MTWVNVEVWVDDDITLDDSALDAIQSAAANEAYEQSLVMRHMQEALNGSQA